MKYIYAINGVYAGCKSMCICSIKCSYKLNFKHMLHILNSLSLSPTLSISCTLHTHTHSDSKDHLTQITVHKFTAENCSMNFFLVILFFSILEVYSLDVVDTFFFLFYQSLLFCSFFTDV